MTTATAPHPTTVTVTAPAAMPPSTAGLTLGAAVAAASEAVVEVPLDDARWDTLGPQLTAFVDAARRVAGQPGSPIRPADVVAHALRLRDLGRLAQGTAGSGPSALIAPAEAAARLRSLLVAGRR